MEKKFTPYAIATFLLFLCLNTAQSQTWQWAKSGNGFNGFAEGLAVCTDPTGNAIASGFFQSPTIVFGSFTLSNPGSANGDTKVFIVKYSPTGTVLWARAATGTGTQEGRGICADASGNIYACGYFSGPSITFGSSTLINTGGGNAYLVKYDANGNFIWAKCSSAFQGCVGHAVTTDVNGDVLLNGWFTGPSAVFGTFTLTQTGTSNVCLVKYDQNGNVIWAKKSIGAGNHFSFSVSTDAAGNSYITGGFSGATAVFGTFTLTNSGSDDIFVAKYDPNGNVLWVKSATGTGSEKGQGLSVDASANLYVTGFFGSSSLAIGSFNLTNTGSNDAFIAKYDSNGNVLWAKSTMGTGNDYGYAVAAVNTGVFVTGCMGTYGAANGGAPVTVGSFNLVPPQGATDPMFIAEYDLNGNVVYAEALGAGGDDVCAIAADKFCNVYISGDFYNLDPFIIGNYTLNISGIETAFTAKLSYNLPVSVSSNNFTICAGESATLTAAGVNSYTWSNGIYTNINVVTPSVTTGYTVNGTSTLQCPAISTTVSVVVKPAPTLTASSNKVQMCKGESATLTAQGATGYAWGQGGTTATVKITPSVTTTYTVTGSLANGCSKTMTLTQIVNLCEGIESTVAVFSKISVSPNPVKEILNIQLNDFQTKGLRIRILNGLGQTVMDVSPNDSGSSVDMRNFPAGLYFVNITGDQALGTVVKVIKE